MADRASGAAATTPGARPSLSPLRQRPLARASTIADVTSSAPHSAGLGGPRRRSSFMTADSFDRASFRSSTDSLLLPRVARNTPQQAEELPDGSSHMHSLPLVLALLPPIGGILFKNGSAVLTDVTLLILAAIFLNWSVRLPWDWYHSAQSVRLQDEAEAEAAESYFPPQARADTILEETSQDGLGEEDATTPGSPPSPRKAPGPPSPAPQTDAGKPSGHDAAARELRLHELLALVACFVCPLLGAWLLHHIRTSLSRPSEGLVSDYNLSIFVLASELRPLSHLLRMIQSRTLHLQRVVAAHPHASGAPPSDMHDLQTRLDELEAHVAAHAPTDSAALSSDRENDLARSIEATLRAALQPELDAVTRATRRYEKRAMLLGLQTESRLNSLEARVHDAVALAAGAERAQQERRRSGITRLLDAGVLGVAGAADLVLWVLASPLRGMEWVARTAGRGMEWTVGRFVGAKGKGAKKKGKSTWKGKEQSIDGVDWSSGTGAKKAERRTSRVRKE